MTLVFPSTNKVGNEGSCGFRDVDFKTKQDFAVSLTKEGRRYLIERISLISKTITGVSTGATIAVCEATLGVDTDATITLTSNGTAPADGVTVTLAGKVYTFKDLVKATTTLTSNNTIPSDGDTVTIGNKVYTFKTSLGTTEGNVLAVTNADTSLLNLIRAINHTGTPNTDYYCAAAHTQVSAAASVTAHAFLITALDAGTAGNALATSDTAGARLGFSDTTMTGGTDPTVEGQVKVGVSAATALDNLKAAVNHDAGHGTTYFCAAAHTKITATTNSNTTQLFVASVGANSGRAGNDLTGADTSATFTWTNPASGSHASTLSFAGGLDGTLVNALVAEAALSGSDQDGLVQNLTLAAGAEVLTGGNSLIFSIRNAAAGTVDIKDIDIEYRVI